ncbi:glycosyltransferase family 1 protein [Caloramator sp. E03]|uniref:glycosyltransferase family 1 protein n=1 Tax=Caloramator sp. E03 TaxID=2576307 RepID=UPI0011102DC4|nr:glycosyltransferase family 1 protein [Caloramator sp. E03]QCX32642.1 glycosyltransferase family 1 protein [Caloramator sp. E03]
MDTILYPPTINYYKSYQRPQQLFKALNNIGYRIIFCNYNPQESNSYFKEVFKEFYICNKINPYRISKLDSLPILWITYPPFASFIEQYPYRLLVFDAIDEVSNEFESWQNGLDILIRKADVIFTTSHKLFEYHSYYRDDVFLCPNGADYEYFNKASNIFSDRPCDMPKNNNITVGYFGAIATWINWPFVNNIANLNPDINFVFIGPLFNLARFPLKLNNVYYLKNKNYDRLINYLQYFDICFIPFKITNMTRGCNPIKMYEYLSAGKIVVATDFDEAKMCKYVYTINSKDYLQFRKFIDNLLAEDSEELRLKRIEFAKNNSWQNRARLVDEVLKRKLGTY